MSPCLCWLCLVITAFYSPICTAKQNRLEIKELHIVVSNHLDCGYTDLLVNVVNKYFDDYFPKIRRYGEELNALGLNISWVYTTQSWLVSLYLECPPYSGLHCPTTHEKDLFLDSILNRQEITWHAFPFNSQLELYDASMLEYGVWLSTKYLPAIISNQTNQFQIPTVLSQRDVPSMTRSVIPVLKKNGIRAISIGCNEWSAAPDTPNIFRWLDPISNEEIITMIHAGNYGGFFPQDVVMIDNYSEAIMFAWNGDNDGPFDLYAELLPGLAGIQEEFPNAYVHPSTFDNYIDGLMRHPQIINSLNVIDKEIGDTWQYGPPSDPLKLTKFRIAQRHRTQYLEHHSNENSSYAFNNFSRLLLKNGEHTFGIAEQNLGSESFTNNTWSNPSMKAAMMDNTTNQGINKVIYSWHEQRDWGIEYALNALQLSSNMDDIELFDSIIKEFAVINKPESPLNMIHFDEWTKIENVSQTFNVKIATNPYVVGFNSTTGALSKLLNINTGMNYINSTVDDNFVSGLGLFYYSTRTEADFQEYWNEYAYRFRRIGTGPVLCEVDFCKNGLRKAAPFVMHQNVISSLVSLYKHKTADIFIVETNLGQHQTDLETNYGAPDRMYNIINFTSIWNTTNIDRNSDGFSMQFTMINKTWTRIPESLWFVFNSNKKCNQMLVNKIGEMVNINDVVRNGSWHLHSVDPNNGTAQCMFDTNAMRVQSIDAALAGFVPYTFNEFTTFPIPLNMSNDLSKGVAFSLFDNTWNTNYPFWYPFDANDTNSTYRFNVFLS